MGATGTAGTTGTTGTKRTRGARRTRVATDARATTDPDECGTTVITASSAPAPSTVTVLEQNGILRAAEVVELAALAGLELAAAATLLEKESSGGRNIYGHDGVDTGGFYTKGGPVTQETYLLYRAHRAELGAQGVGPTQLTYGPFQDRADRQGGCWDWRVNTRVGFDIVSGLIKAKGVRSGFRAYNGSGAAAEAYADDALKRLRVWRDRLDPATVLGDTQRPTLREGDTGPAVLALQKFLNKTFPGYSSIDLTPKRYGPQTCKVVAEFQRRAGVSGPGVSTTGKLVGSPTWGALEHYGFR